MVALKLCSYQGKRPAISIIAADLKISPSEVHAAIKRLQQARLLHGPEMEDKPNLSALEEFLLHGVKYAFPAEHGPVTRGVPTSFAAPPLNQEIVSGDELPPVWPWREGETRGIALEPLYKTAPAAALRDPALYHLLALVDAIRDGRARAENGREISDKYVAHRGCQSTISIYSLTRLAFASHSLVNWCLSEEEQRSFLSPIQLLPIPASCRRAERSSDRLLPCTQKDWHITISSGPYFRPAIIPNWTPVEDL